MNSYYWQFRLAFYRHSIKEMRETIQQLGMAVVVLFQVAIPAVFLFFLMGLGQLAEPELSTKTYTSWLGGYGILIYGLMRFQRQAILALPVRFWNNSLPVGKRQRTIVVITLCLLAGNVFLLLPAGLLFYLFFTHIPESLSVEGFNQLWPLILSCFWGVQSTVLALYRRRFPLFVLIVVPVFVWFVGSFSEQSWWLTVLLLGPALSLINNKKTIRGSRRLRFFWQLLLAYQVKNWQSILLKIAALILSCLFFSTMIDYVSDGTKNWVVLCCILISTSLASTIQFSLISFKEQYHYFLSSLPISNTSYRRQFLLFVGVFGGGFLLTTCFFIGFSILTLLCWSTFYVLGLWAVNKYRQRFFVPMIALFSGLGVLLATFPLS